MKKTSILIFFICLAMAACTGEPPKTAVTTEESTKEVTILTEQATVEVTTAEVTTTEVPETTEIIKTTEVTTTEVTTTEVTTAATTAITTAKATTAAATAAVPMPQKSPHVQTVLEGEYTFGSEPVIENIDGFTYVNGILIVNKTFSLPEDFNPAGLHPDAENAFNDMKSAASAEGLTLKIISGFRPYSQQESTYNNYCKRDGKELADRYSARPGHSEHQTGLAMDINSLRQSFGETNEGKWLAEHCAEYGFILRYGKEKEEATGFMYEPWHIRYVGVEIATAVTESGLALEEYLGITSAYPTEGE